MLKVSKQLKGISYAHPKLNIIGKVEDNLHKISPAYMCDLIIV